MADYFVDFSAANNGDGSDGAQAAGGGLPGAFNQLTASENATITSGDSVWLRRTGVGSTKTIVFKDGVKYHGWPKSTDENYADRPTNTVDSTWNSDGDDHTFFTAPTAAWTPVDIEVWRLRGSRTTSNNAFFYLTGSFQNFLAKHCVAENSTAFGYVYVSGGLSGVGRFKMRDCKLRGTNADTYFAVTPQTGTTGHVDVELEIESSVANNNDFIITVNQNNTNQRTTRVVLTGYTNTGTGRCIWSVNGGEPGMITVGFKDGATGFNKCGAVTVTVNQLGGRVRLLNMDQTTLSATTGLTLTGTRDSLRVEAVNCVFVGSTQDILFTGNGNVRLIGRNVTFDKSKVTFGGGASYIDPDHQCIFVEGFGGTKGKPLRMNSRGFQEQSSAYRTGGADQSVLMETRTQGNVVGNPEPFLLTDGFGLEYLRALIDAVESKTVTVYIYKKDWDGNDNKSKIWLEVDYYDEASGAHVATASSRDESEAPAALTADGSTWNSVSGGTAHKLEVTFTPGQTGYCAVRVCMNDSYNPGGNRSKVYVDPLVAVSA